MPQPPEYTPASYYRHNFDLGHWRFVRHDDEEGYAWFEPIDDDRSPASRAYVLPPEVRRRRYHMASMTPLLWLNTDSALRRR